MLILILMIVLFYLVILYFSYNEFSKIKVGDIVRTEYMFMYKYKVIAKTKFYIYVQNLDNFQENSCSGYKKFYFCTNLINQRRRDEASKKEKLSKIKKDLKIWEKIKQINGDNL